MRELALQSTCAVQVTYKKARFEVAANPALSSPTSTQKKRGLRTGKWAGLENWQVLEPTTTSTESGAGPFFPQAPTPDN